MSVCSSCKEKFIWNDTVVVVDDDMYHRNCLDLYPTGYYAFIDGKPLGETENDDGEMAYELIDGLLTEDEEEYN